MKVYHDHDENDSWTEITGIITYPSIVPRLDQFGVCTVVIRDFEGALYATWKDYDFIPMKVEDDSANILFRGYLTGKRFKHNQLTLTLAGLGVMLAWESFSSNYILEQGKVSSVPAGTNLVLEDLDGNPFTWAADYWNSGEQNKGLLIVDNTESTENKIWDVSEVTCVWGNSQTGDYTDTLVKNDETNFVRYREDPNTFDAVILLDTDGVGIPDTSFLQKIVIDFQFGMLLDLNSPTSFINAVIELKIKNGLVWDTLKTFSKSDGFHQGEWRHWIDNPTITIEGTDAALRDYFGKIGSDYTSLKGLKLVCSGSKTNADDRVYWEVDYINVRVYYHTADISPIMKRITDSADSWVACQDTDDWSITGVSVGDSFKIGENCNSIINDLAGKMGLDIYVQTTLSKYMARWFKGNNGLEVIKAVCNLEGTHWFEDYVNNRIIISAEADMVDSTVDLTQGNYDWDWEFEDDCNNFYKVEVFGSASLGIYAYAEDTSVNSYMVKMIIDETIMTVPDAQEVANEQLAIWKVKRPSIRIPLKGVNANLQIGKTVTLTMVRPTVAEADYPIRMIERSKLGTNIKTVIYCGLGHSEIDEKIGNIIRESVYLAHKAHTDRLISTPLGEGAVITWNSIGGKTAGVEGIITTELGGGESIDNAIDALIAAHHAAACADHDDRYYTETELNDGQLDNRYYTEAEVDAHNWLEADITDLDKYTQAQINAIAIAVEDRFDEQSAGFPANPVEGDFHYDENLDSLYRYNEEALAWIEVGVGGGKSTADDNLGNHVCTQDLNLQNEKIISNDVDTYHIFGRVWIGYDSVHGDHVGFGHRDQRSGNNYALLQDLGGTTYLNAKTGCSVHHRINNSDIMNMNASGLQIGSDARITEFDAETLVDSDTKAPTSKAVRDAIVNAYTYGSYTGIESESKLIQSGAPYFKQVIIVRTDSAGAWVKFLGMGTKYSTAMATGVYTDNTIEIGAVGLQVWGDCNVNGATYKYWGIRTTV